MILADMESKKVIHVHLIGQSFNGQTDFYFGSVAAIYDTLSHSVLGIKQRSLMQTLWKSDGVYENPRCRVIAGEIIRKTRKKQTGIS